LGQQVAIGFSENSLSEFARQRFLQFEKPLFITDWMKLVFIHFEIEPKILQPFVPFELDLYQGKAWVALVSLDPINRLLLRRRPRANSRRLFRLFARQSSVKLHDRRPLLPFFDVSAVVGHFCFSVTTTSFLFRIFAHP
jgi:uncharacterized protein YqjF (DUF2071 family)